MNQAGEPGSDTQRHSCDTQATLMRHSSDTQATLMRPSSFFIENQRDTQATLKRHSCDTQATLKRHSSDTQRHSKNRPEPAPPYPLNTIMLAGSILEPARTRGLRKPHLSFTGPVLALVPWANLGVGGSFKPEIHWPSLYFLQ